MVFARTILAFLIALSVALLPATGTAGLKSKSHDMTAMSAHDSMDDSMDGSMAEPMDDCCPHAIVPCDKDGGQCSSMAACTINCLSFAGGASSPFIHPVTLAALLPPFEGSVLFSQMGSPPFRPPRG
jgi:hypothetical protein